MHAPQADIDAALRGKLHIEQLAEWEGGGWRAKGYGRYAGGGNVIIGGPTRLTMAEAINDVDRPQAIEWTVIGHLCG